jgi:hypothetical protein
MLLGVNSGAGAVTCWCPLVEAPYTSAVLQLAGETGQSVHAAQPTSVTRPKARRRPPAVFCPMGASQAYVSGSHAYQQASSMDAAV